jgi:hypothetical protein
MASGDTLLTLTPEANEPPSTNYATLDLRNSHPLLAFDDTTQEAAIFSAILPRTYAGGGITAALHWAAASAVTGNVAWDLSFERDAAGGQDLDADGFATAIAIAAVTVPGTSGIIAISNQACTDGAQIDSIAVGDLFRLRVRRDPASDSAAGDAQLLAIELKET